MISASRASLSLFAIVGVRRIAPSASLSLSTSRIALVGRGIVRQHRSSSTMSSLASTAGGLDSNSNAVRNDGLEYTNISDIATIVNEARQAYNSRITRPYDFRMAQLHGLQRLVEENSDALTAALADDLGQGPVFAEAFELTHVIGHARHARSNLQGWMATVRKPTPFPVNLNLPVHTELRPNPRGVALLVTPWNLPVQMNMNPLIDALAAGNVCVLKMSERSVRCTGLLTELLTNGKYVDPRVVRVVNGGAAEATELLRQRFDAMYYTGGGAVGRIVAQAAAKNLTPVLLELGGKNPVFVTKNAHIPSAAMRIAWGKVSGNAGQMCICPDYVLVEESVKEEFVSELCRYMDQMYPVSSYASSNGDRGDVGKMISVDHAKRVVSLVDSTSTIIYGGKHHDVEDRFVAPTIVEATADSTVMKEEIFGPVLAVCQARSPRYTARTESQDNIEVDFVRCSE